MLLPATLQSYIINDTQLELYVPDADAVQQYYTDNKSNAYWAKVWPASIALCHFIQQNPAYINSKNILELAAGLGLPGLFAAKAASHVTISDIEPLAAGYVLASAQYLHLSNVTATTLNWTDAVQMSLPDVLLLSDVNYEPAVFETLQQVLEHFLNSGVTVIISTPQRLVAKQFMEGLLLYSVLQQHFSIELNGTATDVSVFVLSLHRDNISIEGSR